MRGLIFRKLSTAIAATLLVGLCGCVGTNAFSRYPRQAATLKEYLAKYDFEGAYAYLEPKLPSQDSLLYLQERGRIHQLAGELDKSKADFEAASTLIEGRRFDSSLGQTAGAVGAVILNDSTRPYEGWAYEKVFLHTYQALNYLQSKDLEGALVEIRRASNEERYETQRRALSQELLEAKAQENDIDWKQEPESLQEVYKGLNSAIGAVKKTYLNGFTSYLSGLGYELAGDIENARVSYRQALELYPKNTFLKQALRRTLDVKALNHASKGRLIILYEEGFIPTREQIKVPIPYHGRIYTLVLPYLQSGIAPAHPLRIGISGKTHSTQELCQTGALAALALKEEYPSIILRHLIRLILRDQTQKQVQTLDQKQGLGGFLGLGTAILGYALDNADQRSWSTLPQSIQIAELYLEPGEHAIVCNVCGEASSLNVNLETGQVRVVYLVKTGERVESRLVW